MSFKMKYTIETMYLPKYTKRRSGIIMPRVRFLVAHDTGNDGSTAYGNINYYINSANIMSASAHTFIDDKHIVECIPLTTGIPEKAWHVLYDRQEDNRMFGDDANDVAGAIELCYFYNKPTSLSKEERYRKSIEAYKRYVWYHAYCCHKFKLNPLKNITGHFILDPKRKTDPENALSKIGKTFEQFIQDVIKEYDECLQVSNQIIQGDDENMKINISDKEINYAFEAIDSLYKKGLINNHEEWKKKLKENPEEIVNDMVWVIWVLFDRITRDRK